MQVLPRRELPEGGASLVTDAQLEAVELMDDRQFNEKRVDLRTLKGAHELNKPKESNQDALFVTQLELGPEKKPAILAGVYDGHGHR